MIISRTPLRISFCGGGTDLREFYRHEPGAVTSTTINKYIYVTVNKKFDHKIRLSYSKTEMVDQVDEIQHDLVREAMKLTGVTSGIEITTMADIPASGTGLGSSSSLTVGLLNALYAYRGIYKSAKTLAEQACKIEIDIVGEPIGKQDQYIAAYGGIQYINFMPDESVFVDPAICTKEFKDALQSNLLLFYTGITRKTNTILTEQKEKTKDKLEFLHKMAMLAKDIRDVINGKYPIDKFGDFLHQGWELKKKLADGITNPGIDEYYQKSLKAGAIGGKILGAGGGGFLLVYCTKEKQDAVRNVLKDLREEPFRFEPQGSKIIYVEE